MLANLLAAPASGQNLPTTGSAGAAGSTGNPGSPGGPGGVSDGTPGLGAPTVDGSPIAPSGLADTAVLPPVGFGGAASASGASSPLGGLRRLVEPPPAAGGGHDTTPEWLLTPGIGVSEEYTDNALGTPAGGGDLISVLQPSLAVRGGTPRLQVNLAYDPQVYLYANESGQNRVANDFNARALATLVPETLFLDLRGTGAEVAQFGGLGPSGTAALSNDESSQNYSFSAAPYVVHRFGSTGTGEVGYTVERTLTGGYQQVGQPFGETVVPGLPPGVPLAALNQDVTTENAHAAFATGEDFGRYNGTVLASGTRFSGTGVLSDAHRDIFSIDNGYAITRNVVALATLGYEDLHYAGTTPISVQDLLWNAGIRLIPGANSQVTATYGHHDGFDALTFDASLAPTPRLRLAARYSAGLTTGAEQLQNALASTDLDQLGQPIDHSTGTPVFDASNFFGLNNGLYRLRRLSLSATYVLPRDILAATIVDERTKQLSAGFGQLSFGSSTGTFGTLSWSDDLTPLLTGTAFVEYGEQGFDGPPVSDDQVLSASVALTYQLGPGLTATAQYSFNRTARQSSGLQGDTTTIQNVVLLSAVKTF